MPISALQKLLFVFFFMFQFSVHAQNECGTADQMRTYLKNHPAYSKILESQNLRIQANTKLHSQARTEEVIYQIPIVVHVMQDGFSLISDTQIRSAIRNLNDAFRGRGSFSTSPDTKIEFVLASKSPDCQETTGIIRVDASDISGYSLYGVKKQTRGADEKELKALSKWNNLDYYNIWIVHKIDGNGDGIAGFTYYPESSARVDGMTILAKYFTADEETLVHEMGHAFSLYHTFEGDNSGTQCPSYENGCGWGRGDCLEDTEPHKRSAFKMCLSGLNNCISESYKDNVRFNHMNYYCDSRLFTEGQKQRMRSAIETTSRSNLIISEGKNEPENLPEIACIPSQKSLHYLYGIKQINLNNLTINSGTSKNDGTHYSDYSCMRTAHLEILEKYNLSLKIPSSVTHIFGVWADWNNDGDFDDVGETISHKQTGTNANLSFTVPANAKLNQKLRFRVMADEFSNQSQLIGCQSVNKGQVQDFAVKITESTINQPEITLYHANQFLPSDESTVNFSETNTGSFSEQIITVHNLGNSSLVFDNQDIEIIGNTDFLVSSTLPSSVSAGNSANFTLRFTPTSDGEKTAKVVIRSNDTDENNYSFLLSSKATKPVIQLSKNGEILTANSVVKEFGKINVGDKIKQEFTLKNIGTGTLHFTDNQSFELENNVEFSVLNFEKKSLNIGEEMTFSVEFSPISEGEKTTKLALFSNASQDSYDVFLTGNSVLSKIKLFQDNKLISNLDNHLNFENINVSDSITKIFEIRNIGEGYLKVLDSEIISNSPEIFEVFNLQHQFISSNENTYFSLKISPKQIESETAKIQISTNDIEQNPFIFFVTVSGVASKIELYEEDNLIENEDYVFDFGTVILGESSSKQHLKIKNIGNKNLDFSNIFVSGMNPNDFTIKFTSVILKPSEIGVLEMVFSPTVKNTRNAEIILENNTPYQNPYRLKIKGKGIPIEPDIEVSGLPNRTGMARFSSGTFEPVRRKFTIKNTGILPLHFNTAVQISGEHSSEFQVVELPLVSVLAPQENTTFEVEFHRKNSDEKKARITILSDDPDENPYSFLVQSDEIPPPPPTTEEILRYPFPEIHVEMQESHFQLVWWGGYPIKNHQFEIYRSVPNQTEPELIAVIQGFGLQENSFIDTVNLENETNYTYSIRAVVDELSSELKGVDIITPPELPKLDYNKKVCEENFVFIRVEKSENTKKLHWYESDTSTVPLTNELGEIITLNTFKTPILSESKTYYVSAVGEQFENPKRLAILAEIEQKPVAKILADSIIQFCDNQEFILKSELNTNAQYIWYRNGIIFQKDTHQIQITRSGNYTLELKTETCQDLSNAVEITVLKTPKIEIEQTENLVFCGEGLVSVKAELDVEYQWFDGNNNLIKKGNIINVYDSDTLLLKAINPNGCSITEKIAVVVNPYPPTPIISVNNPICEGEKVQFLVENIFDANYSWKGFLLDSDEQNPTIDYSNKLKSGTYSLTVEVNGCESFATVDLIVGSKMDYSIENQDITCYDAQDGNIEVTSNNESILIYRLGEFGQMQFGKEAQFDSLDYGNHTLIIENEEGCEEIHEIFIDQPEDFTVSVVNEEIITSRWKSVNLEAFGASSYRWFPADSLNSDSVSNPIANPSETTIYHVIGYDENGCERTSEVTVTVLGEDEILPNLILSPNGDGLNDFWEIQNIEMFPNLSIEIYTKMGLKIFEQTDYQNNWDGTWEGRWLPEGTYFYKIYLPEENRVLSIGDVNLIR